MTDQMPFGLGQFGDFSLRFLYAIFSQQCATGGKDFLNFAYASIFCHNDQLHIIGIAAASEAGFPDAAPDLFKISLNGIHFRSPG
jgi:hypothetical protein